MRMPVDGRRRFSGRLLGLEGNLVRLATQGGEIALPIADMAKAKLVLTDELLAASQAGRGD
jgi:ribosome maturation factor RimP